jgi:hypothetical protein
MVDRDDKRHTFAAPYGGKGIEVEILKEEMD